MKIAESIRKSTAIMLCGMALAISTQAAAGLGPVISQAYEVLLSDFRAPGVAGGTIAFKECETCETRTMRVSGGTAYVLNGKAVKLEDFRKALAAVNDREKVSVTVLHHLESDTIESISVSL